ncbi:hypothetical protein HYFRA_00013290 [Hymenoscyphus fraxineus]|uniref:DUF7587 domain-containing protein n=1 Tax=Hymenoscyphus fraxineus TaxID=746836 RepID=A0A9N9PNT7_9HELO|nr:hypothetical protein HYFRA_00013290 [Hymenoscyphus fraxineus]
MATVSDLLVNPFMPPDRIPRYLYRTARNKSLGKNSLEKFESSWVQSNGSSIFRKLDPDRGRLVAELHLKWKTTDGENRVFSDLISWSNTLLFSLQFAVREYHEGKRDVQIYILDTWALSESERENILSATYLIENLGVDLQFRYPNEFLVIGELHSAGHCDRIALEEIFRSFPSKKPDKTTTVTLMREVDRVRTTFFNSTPKDFTESYLGTVHSLCQNLRADFQVPFFLGFVSLEIRPPCFRSSVFWKWVQKWFETNNDNSLYNCIWPCIDSTVYACQEAEIKQYSELLDTCRAIYQDVQDCAELRNKSTVKAGSYSTRVHESEGEELEDDPTTGYSYESDTDSVEENNIDDDIIKRIEDFQLH